MAMSDCEKCWNTPCSCGWDYKDYGAKNLSKHIALIAQYRTKEEAKAIILEAFRMVDKIDGWHDREKKENKDHYKEALQWIKDGYSVTLLDFYYHSALLHNDADKAAGIKKAMEENNTPVSEKIVKPKK